MEDIYKYIQKPLTERQEHLRLDEECYSRGGQSYYQKGLLANILDTTIPKGHQVLVCHACHNADCDNPHHIYWGTPKENHEDKMRNGGLTFYEKNVRKYGQTGVLEMNKKAGKLGGHKNGGKPKTEEHKQKIKAARARQVFPTKIGL